MDSMSGTGIGTETETQAVMPEWKPERRILTASEVDGFYTFSGTLELRIDRFAEFVCDEERRQSEPVYIRGLPFEMYARCIERDTTTNNSGQSPSKDIFVVLSFNQSSTWTRQAITSIPWKCQAITTLRVVAQKEGVNDIIRQDTKAYFSGSKDHVVPGIATCDVLLDPENGFNKDDTIILQAHVQASSVKIMTGIFAVSHFSTVLFSSSAKFQSDFVLIIEDKEVHVQKSYLEMHSGYFKNRFEGVNKAILQDVPYDDFIELLTVIYPTAYPITVCNVEAIMELAFKFFMGYLLNRCEGFLMENNSKFPRATILLIAEWYGLADLTVKIVDQIRNIADIKKMKRDYDELSYQKLSYRTKRMLFDRICLPGPVANPVSEPESMSIASDRAAEILQELASSVCFPPDGILIVENKRVPIHKTHLALYSEHFTAMFQGEFAERNMDEIMLEEIGYNEILELLQVIYPTVSPITDANVEVILKLADRFVMPVILVRCRKLLQDSTAIRAARKLWLAQRYNLRDLRDKYAMEYRTMSDIEELKVEPEFALFDDKTRALILESIIS